MLGLELIFQKLFELILEKEKLEELPKQYLKSRILSAIEYFFNSFSKSIKNKGFYYYKFMALGGIEPPTSAS